MTDIPRKEYPRPQFVRKDWLNLNGVWTCEFDPGKSGQERGLEKSTGFSTKIVVPFCPESALSGLKHTDFIEQMFYHRKITVPAEWSGKQILLQFGGVDYECEGFLDGQSVGTHQGGSSAFFFDLTEQATPGKEQDFVLLVKDDTRSCVQPGGKQSQKYKSAGCSYTRTTGIWQTVWMEPVDKFGLKLCRITPDLDNGSFLFEPKFFLETQNRQLNIKILMNGKTVGEKTFAANTGAAQNIELSEIRPWSPEDPFLYDVELTVLKDGATIDSVSSYSGLRKIHVEGDKFYLNNKPVFFRFVLDQGFYREGIWTAPSDDELKKDIERAMAVGFNGARLHQKVFEARFHYWADKLGYLTWGESPSWGLAFNGGLNTACPEKLWISLNNFLHEWRQIMEDAYNAPSIIAWSPTNETAPGSDLSLYRKIFSEIYDVTKTIDPIRPCNEASGYRHVKTDLWTVHVYRKNVDELKAALETKPVFMLSPDVEAPAYHGQPYINDEFGGFLYLPPEKTSRFADNTWGYYGIEIRTPEDYVQKIREQVEFMASMPNLSGFCFTQLTDIEQEQNGVYTYDRIPKASVEELYKAFTAGKR